MFFFSIGLDRLSIMIIGIGVRQVLMNKTQQQTKHRRCEQTQQTLSCANIFAMSCVQQQRNIAHRIKRNIAHRTSLSFANIFANKTQQTRNGSIAMTHRRNVGARHRPRIMVAPKEKKASRLCMASKPSMDGLRSCAI